MTREVRDGGRRVGFEIETFTGECGPLAHVGIDSPHRLGRCGADVDGFERIALPALAGSDDDDSNAIYLVDEIGKMECLSERFVEAMRALLGSPRRGHRREEGRRAHRPCQKSATTSIRGK